MSSPVLEVRELVKTYPKVQAVRGVSFEIPEGRCFGLLGPNGAGKTTTVEMMEGITAPTSGEILFRGRPIDSSYRERIGIQFQSTALPDYIRVDEVLSLFQSFYRSPAELAGILERCALSELLERDVHELSGGQRQRVLLALALVNSPELIFLDEPTTGLDPQARRNFWELVKGIKREGRTVLLTTHYMEEAYELCDEIAIMDQGQILSRGKPDELLKKMFDGVSIEIPKADLASALEKVRTVVPETWFDRDTFWELQTAKVNETFRVLMDVGVPLNRVRVRSRTLEDLFLAMTGKGLRG